jgi:hypothetical protein
VEGVKVELEIGTGRQNQEWGKRLEMKKENGVVAILGK